jgi:hypothetical protein
MCVAVEAVPVGPISDSKYMSRSSLTPSNTSSSPSAEPTVAVSPTAAAGSSTDAQSATTAGSIVDDQFTPDLQSDELASMRHRLELALQSLSADGK